MYSVVELAHPVEFTRLMRRRWLRLVTYLSLAAFVLANQPAAVTAFARCGNDPDHKNCSQQHSADCCHCDCLKHEKAEDPSPCDCEACCGEATGDPLVESSQPTS